MEEQCVNFCIQYVHNSLPKMCYLVKCFGRNTAFMGSAFKLFFIDGKNIVQTQKIGCPIDNVGPLFTTLTDKIKIHHL